MFEANYDHRQLKSKLLAGAAGIAAVAATSAAYADDAAQKWSWAVDAGGGVGSGFTAGKIDLLAPVWQDMDSLLFVRLGASSSNEVTSSYNLGLGYRAKIDPEWILGLYAGWDGSTTEFDHHSFNQVALGAELMSTDWDFRINGYVADKAQKTITGKYELFIHDTRIAILQGQEAALSGLDGEVGYRVFHTDDTDVRLFVGGFWFDRSDAKSVSTGRTFDFAYGPLAGPKGRAEVNVFDLDGLGAQSRLSFEGEIAHDDRRGTTGFVGATVRIPLDVVSGGGAQALDDLDRRMVDPVRRNDNVLTQWNFSKPEPVIIYGPHMRSQPTNTLLYVDNSVGLGSYPDPTTLHDATTRTTVGTEHYINSFIVITSKEGDVLVDTAAKEGFMQSGQSLVGGNETFKVHGTISGLTYTHTFAPGTTDPSLNAMNYTNPVNLIGTDHDNVYGFTIEGTFEDAIYGHNVDHLNVSKMRIDGKEDGQAPYGEYGLYIRTNTSKNMNLDMWGDNISHVQEDGVELVSDIEDYGSSTQHITMINVNVTDAGEDGIDFDAYTYYSTLRQTISITGSHVFGVGNNGIDDSIDTYGGYIRQTIGIHNSTVFFAGNYGMYFKAYAGGGGTAIQTITIDPTFVHFNGTGIGIQAYADDATVYQFATLTDVYAGYNYYDNIRIGADASDGFVDQGVVMYDTRADDSFYGRGVVMTAFAEDGGAVFQSLYSPELDANGNYLDNIHITGSTRTYGYVHQNVDLPYLQASNSDYGNGVYMRGYAYNSGTTVQNLFLFDIDANHNYLDGVHVEGYAKGYFDPTLVTQYVGINYGDFFYNENGVSISTRANGPYATTYSYARVRNSFMSDNYNDGARFKAYAAHYGSAQQVVDVFNDEFDFNYSNGAVFLAESSTVGFASQKAYVFDSEFDDNGNNGLVIGADAFFGGVTEQNALLAFNEFDSNENDGVLQYAIASKYTIGSSVYYSSITQNVLSYYFSADFNEANGWGISDVAFIGGNINQLTYLVGGDMSYNGANGLYDKQFAYNYSTIYSNLYVLGSTADHNTLSGIVEKSDAVSKNTGFDYTYIVDTTVVAFSHADHNGLDGFSNTADAENIHSLNIQYVTLYDSTFDHNARDGAQFYAYQKFGPGSFGAAIQDVTIVGSDFSHDGRDGLHLYAEATANQGRAEQHFNIFSSTFDHNGDNGIYIGANAHDGVYVAGFPCQYVQGLLGGCAFVRQTVNISNSDASYNTDDGIYMHISASNYGAIYTYSGRPNYQPTLQLYNTTVDDNGLDGLGMVNTVGNASYLYQYVLAVNSHFDSNTRYGIYGHSHMYTAFASGPSQLIQIVTLYGYDGGTSSADFNGREGIDIYTYAYGGYFFKSIAVNAVNLVYADVSYNGQIGEGDGVEMDMNSRGDYFAVQTVFASNSRISYNNGDGVEMVQVGYRDYFDIQQLTALSTNVDYNEEDGARMYQGESYAVLADQYFYSLGSTFDRNDFSGLSMSQVAFFSPTADQHATTYYTSFSYNYDGQGVNMFQLGLDDTIQFSTFYGYKDTIDGNEFDGVSMVQLAYNPVDGVQTFTAIDSNINKNEEDGVTMYQHVTSATLGYQGFYISGTHVNKNGGDGVEMYQVGYKNSVTLQSATALSSTISNNTVDGVRMEQYGTSDYVADIQSFFASGTTVNNNGGFGVYMYQDVDPPILVAQYFYAYYSNFDGNTFDGLSMTQLTVGGTYVFQTAYTYFTGFNNNGGRGVDMYQYNTGPSLDQAQVFYGFDDKINHNGSDGVAMDQRAYDSTYAYQAAITLHTNINKNGEEGVTMYQHAEYATLASQVFYAFDATINHNGSDGVEMSQYGYKNDVTLQSAAVYNSDISYNVGDGVEMYQTGNKDITADIQSFTAVNTDVNYNGEYGVYMYQDSDPSLLVGQYFYSKNSTFDHNTDDGLRMKQYAPGAEYVLQIARAYSSSFSHNGGYGVYMYQFNTAGSFHQYQTFFGTNDTIDYNGEYGVSMDQIADFATKAYQTFDLSGGSISHNEDGGVTMSQDAAFSTYATQTFIADDLTIDHNGGDGVEMYQDGYKNTFLLQQAFAYDSSISYNDGDGVEMVQHGTFDYVSDVQSFKAIGLTDNYNGEYGVRMYQDSDPALLVGQFFYAKDSTFDHNYYDGLQMKQYAPGAEYVLQIADAYSTSFSYNGSYGVEMYQYNTTAGSYHQYQTFFGTNDTIDYNEYYGVSMDQRAYDASKAYQTFDLAGGSVSHNESGGVEMYQKA
ncbi:MAG: hypothetical protein HY243_09760, partial [Proteobacteria bacterium]|nr:hypothetical protein [Pseudomonadota bacterium]